MAKPFLNLFLIASATVCPALAEAEQTLPIKGSAIDAVAAYELLGALDLLDIRPREGLRVGGPADRPDGSRVLRLTLDAEPPAEMFAARGLEILQVELANTRLIRLHSFDLLYAGGDRLIAVFPVFPETPLPRSREDWEAIRPKFFDISPYHFEVPGDSDTARTAKWRAFAEVYREDQALIGAFLKERFQALGEAYPEFLHPPFPYRLHELDAESGAWDTNDFSPLAFAKDPPKDRILGSLETGAFLRLFEEPAPGKHRVVIPTFPTVYALANLTPDELAYLQGVYKEFDLSPEADILVIGPGTGVDTWIASLRTRRPIHVIGINPLEVANTRATAKIAGFAVRALVGDNAADEENRPRFPEERFDAVFWSMPAVWDSPPPGPSRPSFTGFWDGDIGGGVLKRLAKALPVLLKPEGRSLLWNYAPLVEGRNIVAAALESAGTDGKVFDLRVERFLKRSRPPQEWYRGALYTVTPMKGQPPDSSR